MKTVSNIYLRKFERRRVYTLGWIDGYTSGVNAMTKFRNRRVPKPTSFRLERLENIDEPKEE